jgi:hypothetical protein
LQLPNSLCFDNLPSILDASAAGKAGALSLLSAVKRLGEVAAGTACRIQVRIHCYKLVKQIVKLLLLI